MDEFKRFLELKIEHFETESANARLECLYQIGMQFQDIGKLNV